MPFLPVDDCVAFEMHQARFDSYVAPARGSRELCAWRVRVAAGVEGVPHAVSHEEVMLVLDGRPSLTVAGESRRLAPGDVAFVPAGATVGLDNPGDEPATLWVTTSVGLTATTADGTLISPPWTR